MHGQITSTRSCQVTALTTRFALDLRHVEINSADHVAYHLGASPLSVASILIVPANPIHPEVRRCGGRAEVSALPLPRSSECPAFRRDHWAVGRPSVRVTCLPLNRCGQPVGESSHVSCRP